MLTLLPPPKGLLFSNPAVKTNEQFEADILSLLPTLDPATMDYITKDMYPEEYTGSQSYTTPFGRLSSLVSELIFTCVYRSLGHAFANRAYAYIFSVPPGPHGEDTAYTFFRGGSNPGVANATLARALQKYIIQFVTTGSPNAKGLPKFPLYGSENKVLNLNLTGIEVISDPSANKRCDWWQKGLFV
jgi:carboxylesterase type B